MKIKKREEEYVNELDEIKSFKTVFIQIYIYI